MTDGSRQAIWWVLLSVLLAAIVTPSTAAAGDIELGVQGGFLIPDENLTGPGGREIEAVYGLRAGYRLSRRVVWYADGLFSEIDTTTFAGRAEFSAGRTGLDLLLEPERDTGWYATLGGGYMLMTFDAATDFTSGFVSAGIGQNVWVSGRARYRWEFRGDHSLAKDGLRGQDLSQVSFLLGVLWGPGRPSQRSSPTDSDRDGVMDGRDRCPGTPFDLEVNRHGCPIDSDGDGVRDSADACPDTAAGAPVDRRGCPPDVDGDGVWDDVDGCPGTPPGLDVGRDGCPPDEDGDGVRDGIDTCPGTAPGTLVDASGCRLDEDRDGVDDPRDMCSGTPEGVRVSASGCPLDGDGDGVYDGLDRCPQTPRGARVDGLGCPVDSDRDGVWDGLDRCPGSPAGSPVDGSGCPPASALFEQRRTEVLEGVRFEVDSGMLTADSRDALEAVGRALLARPGIRVEIAGHTDDSGSAFHNFELSRRRAESVRRFLVEAGVDGNRLVARGYGESEPVADNATPAGRALNRRVELRRID